MSLNTYQVQRDLEQMFLSAYSLRNVTVRSELKMWQQSVTDESVLWTTFRNGKTGAGILVEMPHADNPAKSVSGPQLDWTFPIRLIEQRDVNMGSQGTGISSEALIELIMGLVHLYADANMGTLSVTTVEPITGYPGCIAYRINTQVVKAKNPVVQRINLPVITINGGSVSLSCNDLSANMYFTLDGTFPGPGNDGSEGANLVPSGAAYDGSGNYTLSGLRSGWVYYFKPNANADLTLVNGTQTLNSAGQFAAQGTSVTLTGTASKGVQALVGAAAQEYTTPFSVTSGTTIRACSFDNNNVLNNSAVAFATAP